MKSARCLLPFLLLLTCCKDKEVLCVVSKYKAPCNINFAGFAISELDTILLDRYTAGTGYTQLLQRDTIIHDDIYLSGDTAFTGRVRYPFASFSAGYDYRLTVPAASRTYLLGKVHHSNDTTYSYTRRHDCGTYGTTLLAPDSVQVDGVARQTIYIWGGTTGIVLSR